MGTSVGSASKAAFDQRLARLAVRPLARTPVTPNMLTFAGMALGVFAGWLFATGEPRRVAWAAAVFVVAAWMDHVDGEHARLTGKTSTFGHYFDHVAAMCTYLAMFVGAGVGLAGGPLGGTAIALGCVAGLSVVAIFSVRMWQEARQGRESVRQTARFGFEIEDTLYVVAPVAWLGLLDWFIVAAGIGAPGFLAWVAREAARRGRRAPPAARTAG
jgi:phosphatidylglycerophosphate synthase